MTIDRAKIQKAQLNLAQKLWTNDHPNEPWPKDNLATEYLDEAIEMLRIAPALIDSWRTDE